ncbi:hypothetical protein A4G18_05815 [Pasteurellaceae bacterium Pebbles2]|nr:hypothetical protein [Pasteurellaceae bacterium Pebbles2]
MNLVLLTFGTRLENHYQACFAILTFLKDPAIKRVVIVTDRKEFYHFLGERVEFIEIDENTLKQWQGEAQFFWRVKIKALQAVQQSYPDEHLLYVDSDVFLAGQLVDIQQKLSQGQPFMHLCEGEISDKSNRTWQKMQRELAGKRFADVEITPQAKMWNAGVIALPAQLAAQAIALSLQLCDEICATKCERRLVEQFSFSLALNHLVPLQACDQVIGHYWGNKSEWNAMIANFFVDAHFKQFSLAECVDLLAQKDWNALPLNKKQRNINRRLKAAVDYLFPAKHIRYFR